ncbi:UvrD-helicase domain-containing protein [Tetragenococcus halophilus]|uniref:UvrD-helicase domain-containing protein n=1 Tax=Tetragenococcus halophilus TaxID=51669 RepID=UPI000CAF864A|nr:UvrD-helicase domain-containing protein [Tetragenococcus halophilus]GBD62427.1 hypothetical protein TEH11_2110 [Tetragenococcus halophilus subsp. halophilus]
MLKKKDVNKYFFNNDYQIYSDKLSSFVVKCDDINSGSVVARISSLFSNIFIDEVQDLAGYDLEIIKRLLGSDSVVKMTGDPRQVTYHTHFSPKIKKYNEGKIQDFITTECEKSKCLINNDTLKDSWRNNERICNFASKLFPEQPQCQSLQMKKTAHDGVFLVKEKDVDKYLAEYSPLQLRYNRRTKKINTNYAVKNFGESKGTTHDRVLIYPTKKMLNWILKGVEIDSFEVKCKFYVAITRAKFSVGIVCKNNTQKDSLPVYNCD